MGFLVLTRRPGERILIGNDIVIEVMETHGGQCRIGIQAPKEIAVHREEIATRIEREKAQAQQSRPQA